MTDIAIRVENLGKMYHIGQARPRHDTLRDAVVERLKNMIPGRADRRSNSGEFWALQDVSFEVERGMVLGVIGRNGAGKSTLLKILSHITEPTQGRAEIHGRVGSLLEVGTGFHPELTGRENVYLNGAILGMKKIEIDRKFDEIVAFAEVEDFLETPVKRYSSGMYVRLAFAVAAHLEPEILLVDEVLAVGDSAFQAKCLGKMGDVAKQGRTILFVSHNMVAVKLLCASAIVITNGHLSYSGSAAQAVQAYLALVDPEYRQRANGLRFENPISNSTLPFEITCVEVLDQDCNLKQTLRTGDYARFRVYWRASEPVEKGGVELGIYTPDGVRLIQYSTRPVTTVDLPFRPGLNSIDLEFTEFPLAGGQYLLSAGLTRPMIEWLYRNDSFGTLPIEECDVFHSGLPIDSSRAMLVVPHRWIKTS